jgi:hypothetical protein
MLKLAAGWLEGNSNAGWAAVGSRGFWKASELCSMGRIRAVISRCLQHLSSRSRTLDPGRCPCTTTCAIAAPFCLFLACPAPFFLLQAVDLAFLHYSLSKTLQHGVSVHLLFAFEYTVQV